MPHPNPTTRSSSEPHGASLIAWIPLVAGLLFTYGPVAENYGFALYFLDYRHGFVKRGLIGECFLPIAHFSRSGLLAIEYAFILAAFALTYLVFRKLLFATSAQTRLFTALLLAAPALLPHIGLLFAQPDVTLYLLLLAALAALLHLPPTPAAFLTTAIVCVAMLAHEAFSLAFYPLIVAILYHLCRRHRLRWSIAILQVILVTAAFLAILHYGKLKVPPAIILAEAAARTTVPVQPQVFQVMASNYVQQRALVTHFYRFPDYRLQCIATILLSIPYFVLLISLLRCATRALTYRALELTFLLTLFALPFTLCWLGHDIGRWFADSAIDITLFLLYLALTEPQAHETLTAWTTGPRPILWLSWNFLTGPFGASALLAAQRLSVLWKGP